MFRKTLAVLAAAAAFGGAASTAHANHVAPNLGIEVTAVDPATRTVQGIVHCTTPDRAGRTETFTVTPDIEFSQFQPGAVWGIAVRPGNVILSTGNMPCEVQTGGSAGPGPVPGEPGGFAPGGPGVPPGPGGAEGGSAPVFARGFLNRVWKFDVAVDGILEGGAKEAKASVTVEKVLNLPKKLRDQDDELVDQDAIVLIALNVRISKNGKRAGTRDIEDSEGAVVHGKLLPPAKWQKDEDDEPVATIRAKKIYLK